MSTKSLSGSYELNGRNESKSGGKIGSRLGRFIGGFKRDGDFAAGCSFTSSQNEALKCRSGGREVASDRKGEMRGVNANFNKDIESLEGRLGYRDLVAS